MTTEGYKISGFVITYNEEDNIGDCLDTLNWVDELVVVDSGSEDGTVEIARRRADRVVHHEFLGYTAQTRFALAETSHPWVIWLDADERLTPEARTEIEGFLAGSRAEEYAGIRFPRKTRFLGRWVTHSGWYPKRKLRFFHRDRGELTGEEPSVRFEPSGSVREGTGDILHYSYPGGMADMLDRQNAFTGRAARARYRKGRRMSWMKLLLEPPFEILKKYFLQLGFLDGVAGLAIAGGTAYYKFVREIKLWELQTGLTDGEDSLEG